MPAAVTIWPVRSRTAAVTRISPDFAAIRALWFTLTVAVFALVTFVLARWLGGYERMLAHHRNLAITPEQRYRFAELMSRAADDAALLAHARARVEALARAGTRAAWLHRARRWNARDRVWMGWERKRGKLEDLNAYLVDGAARFAIVAGDPLALRGVRFVITVDEDMGLQPGAVRRLIAVMAHPLQRACYDPARGRVIAGHGVLQPRMTPTDVDRPTRYGRLLAWLWGKPAADPDDVPLWSDVYQDLLGEGTFYGKGIYDLAVFHRCLDQRFADDQILSHDMLEGSVVRSGQINDVQLLEDIPATFDASKCPVAH